MELIHATAEAIDIIDAYERPARRRHVPSCRDPAWPHGRPRRHAGSSSTRYEVDEAGRIAAATIVPPTSQNQAAIEADLASFARRILDLPTAAATHRLEQLIRSYDPCISCATHFLDLRVDRAP